MSASNRQTLVVLTDSALAELRQMYPELWIVEPRDGGVLLDAFNAKSETES